jgi:hypothetical protein
VTPEEELFNAQQAIISECLRGDGFKWEADRLRAENQQLRTLLSLTLLYMPTADITRGWLASRAVEAEAIKQFWRDIEAYKLERGKR